MNPPVLFTYVLTSQQGELLRKELEDRNYVFSDMPYAQFAAEQTKIKIVLYQSKKLVVQGKGAAEFVEFVLEPLVLKQAKVGYEAVLNPAMLDARIGIDESGKGDFFGPMCIAGVYMNQNVIQAWKGAGIQDSKRIGSDQRIFDLAKLIRQTEGAVCNVVTIGNEAYNRLYRKLASVNKVLAWGHARVLENLMGLQYQMKPPPLRAISDQFASTTEVISSALMSQGRKIELVQRHKAEEDLAVAAASILARNEFVTRLKRMGVEAGMVFPKGASPNVEAVGRDFVAKNGKEALEKVGKMHFRTSYRILGLPEPPKVEWKKGGGRFSKKSGGSGDEK